MHLIRFASLALSASLICASGAVAAAPLPAPSDVPDAWLLQRAGREVCEIRLSGHAFGSDARRATADAACAPVLRAQVVAWRPTADGLDLVASDGSIVASFERWSQSLFVGRGPRFGDVQLSRAFSPPSH